MRGGRKDFTYSRLMCWVAIERAIRMARRRGLPADLVALAGRARRDLPRRSWRRAGATERQAFVQHYGSDVLDASMLLMPLVQVHRADRPALALDARRDRRRSWCPTASSTATTSRRRPDGLRGEEGTFSICSFWYVEALARAGRLDEARLAFEKMLTYANHLGLYSEEIGPTGEQLGNFPQAFTHLALISAAFNLDRALG